LVLGTRKSRVLFLSCKTNNNKRKKRFELYQISDKLGENLNSGIRAWLPGVSERSFLGFYRSKVEESCELWYLS